MRFGLSTSAAILFAKELHGGFGGSLKDNQENSSQLTSWAPNSRKVAGRPRIKVSAGGAELPSAKLAAASAADRRAKRSRFKL